jgi:hypothetical protein
MEVCGRCVISELGGNSPQAGFRALRNFPSKSTDIRVNLGIQTRKIDVGPESSFCVLRFAEPVYCKQNAVGKGHSRSLSIDGIDTNR